jgi:zinc protease
LKIEKYTLKNGLQVVLLEDRATPVVAVNICYKVGSKNEKRGRSGFAHLFEHLMFQGSEHHNRDYRIALEKLGAEVNAITTLDSTTYFETLPSHALELTLWLESDRMGFLLPALTQRKFDSVRDVVKNERRQRIENVPYMQSTEDMLAGLVPQEEPAHFNVAGSMADLAAASLADVREFFGAYYTPNNASLAITGDFKTQEARGMVEKYFGPLPAGPRVPKLKPVRQTTGRPVHVTRSEPVSQARTQLVWPTVERGHPDEHALLILAAVLGRLPRENRLYRTLVIDKQLAVQADAINRQTELGGSFVVTITARPGKSLGQLVEIAEAQIEHLKREGPTADEVMKAQNSFEASLIFSMQSTTRLAGFLNANNVVYGDPTSYAWRLRRLFAVTHEDVKSVARKYLTRGRARLDINPGRTTPKAAEAVAERRRGPAAHKSVRPDTPRAAAATVDRAGEKDTTAVARAVAIKDALDRSKMPAAGTNREFTPPPVVRRKLANGLEVLVAERHQLPILTLRLICRGGDIVASPGKEGLAAITARLLRQGTESRDGIKLAGELSEIGAVLSSNGGADACALSLSTLTRHQARALELFADLLLHPTFPEKDLARIRTQRVAALLRRRDDARGIAGLVFPKLLYGSSHPYGRTETVSSIDGLTRDDAVHFYKKVFLPNNSALIVAGDTTPEAITPKLEESLKGWKPGAPPEWKYPDPQPWQAKTVYLVDKPAAAQSVLTVGHVGVPRNTPDYFALLVLNGALGGQASSRINLNLREEKGYTYDARSSFAFRAGPGPFVAAASVETAKTKEALVELLKEIKDITGSRPITDEELAFAKDRLIKSFPARFETTVGQADTLSELAVFRLADDYFTTYQSKIAAVKREDVARVARKYIQFEDLTILIVGDRKVIEPRLKEMTSPQVVLVLDRGWNPQANVVSDAARAGR